ncbi:unnamed protein product [Symbiodinium sp. KB8]|nr:unnamed protein product [Symbiodinium sp. KB8]
MILAIQLALCGLVQATDEKCLLARPTRTDTLEEDLAEEEDDSLDYKEGHAASEYMKRWEGEWEKQGPLHRLSHFVGLAVRAARDPSRAKLVPTLLSQFWFWPSGDAKEALVSTILQWTQHYVRYGPIKDLNDQVSSHLNAVKVWLERYVQDQRPTVWDLKEARAEAQKALQAIKNSQIKAGGIADYLLAAGSLMAMWREEYNLYGTKEVREKMEGAYKEITDTLKDIVDAFWTWRLRFIVFQRMMDHTLKEVKGVKWTDKLTWASRKWYTSSAKTVEYVAGDVLEREIFVHELAPMLKSFTTLHRLIPGREKDPAQAGPFLPEKVYLGPYSGFIMGTNIGAQVDLLELVHKDSFFIKIGDETGGSRTQTRALPSYTCGMEIAYHEYSMNGIAFMNIKNQSMAIQGSDEERGMDAKRMYTGPGLCGLYTLHQFDKYPEPRKAHGSWALGDGILLSFKWEPVTEEDF